MEKCKRISILTSLYNCEDFLPGYFDALAKIEGKEQIEVLLLHNAPTENELAIINKHLPELHFAKHIIISEREGLYKTWNKGIQLAQGEYITVWNVDDVRFPESILQQAEALDKHPEAAIAYGDIWVSRQYAVTGTFKTNSPLYNYKKEFFKAYHISCFQMWRKSIHKTIGYYDEQFKCSADFDFQIRTAIHFPFVKTDEPLGIYLEDQPYKLSANGLQSMENNIIHLRYGAYQHLNLFRLPASKKRYKQNQLLFFDEWWNLMESSQFNWFSKITGLIAATVGSVYWGVRQIAKKIIYLHEKK